MATKKFSSYAEIDNELEILKLEKEISYQKLVLSFQKAKDSVTPENIISGFIEPYKIEIPNTLKIIVKTVYPYLISYFLNKKRGS